MAGAGIAEMLRRELEAAGIRKPQKPARKAPARTAKKKPAKKKPPAVKVREAPDVRDDPRVIHLYAKAYLANALNGVAAAADCWPALTAKEQRAAGERVRNTAEFQTLIAKEMKKAADLFDMNTEACVAHLVNHLHANPLDYFVQDEEGNLAIRSDLHSLGEGVQQRIRSIRVTTTTNETEKGGISTTQTVDLKTVDPQKALDGLCRHFGVYNASSGEEGKRSLLETLERRLAAAAGDAPKALEAG